MSGQNQARASERFILISGPCQIESREHTLRHAEFLTALMARYPVRFFFKSSFDKANRTSLQGHRGVGIDQGLRILEEVRSSFGVEVLTDIHDVEQARAAGTVVDALQTPAFLCRQTDLLIAAGKYGKSVNVKKGQFLHPIDMGFAVDKVRSGGCQSVFVCERGASFGYRDLVVDMRSLMLLRDTGCPVVYDATHSVQQMGGAGGASSGSRQFVAALTRAAVAVGVDGVFFECHEDPDKAPSDGPCMLPLSDVPAYVEQIFRIREAAAAS
jgi:2-dehydro-3-deoxyphosphooctonate aldolase (KDO 8-P synthase)